MPIDRARALPLLKGFDFRKLFLEELGWDKYAVSLEKTVDGETYSLHAIAEKRGVVVFRCDRLPEYGVRLKLDKLIAKEHFQHLLLFVDQASGRQVWQWMRKEAGRPHTIRTFSYSVGQTGELLFQKLEHLAFSIEEEETLRHGHVVSRMDDIARVDKVTKKFYERFKADHARFLNFVEGIPDKHLQTWYASVMINRLMFLYFIQAKGFLAGDKKYLPNRLQESRAREQNAWYREFLCPLFFQGFARKKEERTAAMNKLLGDIPYLNGGLFQKHEIETKFGKKIEIADQAFENIFAFFEEYDWHLDDRETAKGNEISPDVLGYIFEKYINQKQMGAYYTKEDITGYISRNTIIPFLLDATRQECAIAFGKSGGVWRLLQDDPDRYIYEPVRHGAGLALPPDIAAGLTDIGKRTGWNRTAPKEYALPTEIWREVVERRKRCDEIRKKLASGEVHEVNDLITLNLDITQFAQDLIQYAEGPELIRAFYKAITKISVLDPTCGSGAFLFAALNILKPLYEACLQRMQLFVDELDGGGPHHPKKFVDFRHILAESRQHPKQDYFILKSIIVNNLYGVDIMEEAVEICKLRLFLKLVAQVDSSDRIEPLPDIDFNIRTGNTLVGYSRIEDISKGQANVFLKGTKEQLEDKAKKLDASVNTFRLQQTTINGTVTMEDKADLQKRFGSLAAELNELLSDEYGNSDCKAWEASHKPFHWFSEFHGIMSGGGFSVLIGNPPYVEYAKIRTTYTAKGYVTTECGNLYALVLERCSQLVSDNARQGLIVPLSLVCTDRMEEARNIAICGAAWIPSFDMRPASLFEGVAQRLTILIQAAGEADSIVAAGGYRRWSAKERPILMPTTKFAVVKSPKGASLPKVSSPVETSILSKLGSKPLELFVRKDAMPFFVHRIVRYFVKALDFVPTFIDAKGARGKSEDYKPFGFDERHVEQIIALLNSSLFYWFWRTHSALTRNNPVVLV